MRGRVYAPYVGRMTWTWRYHGPSGADVTAPNESEATAPEGGFPTQADAETWIGEVWPVLRDAGVEAVTLYEGEQAIYGPMSLRE